MAQLVDLEQAVEMVVRWLEEHGHHELAHQVAVATDPTPADERAEVVAAVRDRFALDRLAIAVQVGAAPPAALFAAVVGKPWAP